MTQNKAQKQKIKKPKKKRKITELKLLVYMREPQKHFLILKQLNWVSKNTKKSKSRIQKSYKIKVNSSYE